jgi:uncharacterized membrane protein YeaQ/YmgE (transglycosylase-associated protein family)
MNIVAWIILGGIAGWLASIIMGRNAEQGILGNIIVGVIGGLLGGFIMDTLGGTGITGFNLYSLLVAIGGSVLSLWLYRVIRR